MTAPGRAGRRWRRDGPAGSGPGADGTPPRRRRWSVPVARVAGITVRVHVTFLLLVAVLALTAGDGVGGATAEVAWITALFSCVVVHELAHALVARSMGVGVTEIDLLPIGGVSRLERIPEAWRDEATIAVVGPIASAVVAGIAFSLARIGGRPLWPPTLLAGPTLVRLGWVNLLLAGFNLLPAFPLDGGRVLRALLERDQSRVTATRQAARASRYLAWAMVAVGFAVDPWLIVIGAFVLVAGRAEEGAVLVHAALGPARAATAAVPCRVSFDPDVPAARAAAIADAQPQAAYPVADGEGGWLGSVTAGRLHEADGARPVGELATAGVVGVGASLEDVARAMAGHAVVVADGGRLVGVITDEQLEGTFRRRLHDLEP